MMLELADRVPRGTRNEPLAEWPHESTRVKVGALGLAQIAAIAAWVAGAGTDVNVTCCCGACVDVAGAMYFEGDLAATRRQGVGKASTT